MVFAFLTPESEMILKVLRTKGSKTGVRGVKNTNLTPIKTWIGGVKSRGSNTLSIERGYLTILPDLTNPPPKKIDP